MQAHFFVGGDGDCKARGDTSLELSLKIQCKFKIKLDVIIIIIIIVTATIIVVKCTFTGGVHDNGKVQLASCRILGRIEQAIHGLPSPSMDACSAWTIHGLSKFTL